MNQQVFQLEPQTLEPQTQREPQAGESVLLRRQAPANEVASGEEQRAEATAQNGGAGAIDGLLTRFEVETKRHRKRVRHAIVIGVSGAITVTLVNAIVILAAAQMGTEFPLAIVWGMLMLFAGLLSICAFLPLQSGLRRYFLRKRLLGAARRYADVRVVGPLTEILATTKYALRRRAIGILTELLPQMSVSDAHLLNAEQRQYLCDVLRNGARDEHDLRLAILRAFAQVGDSSVLTQIERLADSPARTWRQGELKAEAQKCLPCLQFRAQHERASRTLLRASAATVCAASLLRPTDSGAITAPTELLRSVDADAP